jgi:hypothetical protein
LAVQVCDRLVKLNERARPINRSFGEYFKLDGEMSEIYLKSQALLAQATKERLPESKTIAGTVNKASPGQIGGVVIKERVVGQSPEVRRMRELRGNALHLRDKIVGDLRGLHQEMSSVASDLAKLPGGGVVPAESKQCLKRASAQFDGELSQMNKHVTFLKPKKGAQSLNTQLGQCAACDENRCMDCCRNFYQINAAQGSPLHAEQEKHQMMCIAHCLVINESCKGSSEPSDMIGMAMDILKEVNERQRDNTRNISNI